MEVYSEPMKIGSEYYRLNSRDFVDHTNFYTTAMSCFFKIIPFKN